MDLAATETPAGGPKISRRSILASLPATMLLAACGSGIEQFSADQRSEVKVDHSLWDQLLGKYVIEGEAGVNLVDYARLKEENAAQLAQYLADLQGVKVETLSRDEQYAFWVNLYNAATVDVILKNYPVDSILDIGSLGLGPWRDHVVSVSGQSLSLDNIEHDILRANWQDVRIHYAVNCASIGCPNLAKRAYTSDNLEEMLEAAAVSFINHPRGFGERDGQLIASNIFEWYQEDWGSVEAVLEHARRYASGPTAELLDGVTAIDGYDYDWTLNKA